MESTTNKVFDSANLSLLSTEKLQELDTVLKSILALPIAQDTYAQIIYGKRTWESKPSLEAREQYEEFRKAFVTQALKLDAQVRRRCTPRDQTSRVDFSIADRKVPKHAAG